MKRRAFVTGGGACALAMLASPAVARDPAQVVADKLAALGYRDLRVRRTLLGRIRINGRRGRETREVVLDPRTGEILRDLTRLDHEGTSDRSTSSSSGTSRSSSSSASNDSSDGGDDGGSSDSSSHDSGSDDGGSDDGGSDDD